jgi:hypothetical protein
MLAPSERTKRIARRVLGVPDTFQPKVFVLAALLALLTIAGGARFGWNSNDYALVAVASLWALIQCWPLARRFAKRSAKPS